MSPEASKSERGASAFSAADTAAYASERDGKMQVQISSFEKGLEIQRGISVIRIRGHNSNLTILEDYTPIVSKVDGDVEFIGRDTHRTLKNIKGFFCHVHNVFFLILNETAVAGKAAKESGVEGTPA
jgi:hypothetical protein